MSHVKQKSSDPRKSPVSAHNKSTKSKQPTNKISKTKPLSNGFHEVGNGVDKRKSPPLDKRKNPPSTGREEAEIAKMNLLTLQKVDKDVFEIVETVPHVVLYHFKTAENVWERTSSEGTLFVYYRSRMRPRAEFMILNRLNSENTKEAIVPGMEFRLQPPFILYGKESGGIYGLCIQNQELCAKTRELLNRLCSEASSRGSSDSSSSPPSPPAQIKQSVSPNQLERQQHDQQEQRKAGKSGSVDVLDMLENAGRNYLGGQCFSDDTDSHDETHSSPPKEAPRTKEGVAPRTTSNSMQGHNGAAPHQVPNNVASSKTEQVRSSPSLSSTAKGGPNGSISISPRTTSSGEAPHHHQATNTSRHTYHSPQKAQNQERMIRQNHTPVGPGSAPLLHGRGPLLHHSASFDQVRSSHGMTPTEVPVPYGGHGGRSNSMFGSSPYATYNTPVAAVPGHTYHSAHLPSRAHSAAADLSTDNSIVRKLFQVPPPFEAPATTGSVSLQTLFSRTATTNSASLLSSSTGSLQGLPHRHRQAPLPLVSAISLDEIEKKLTEEAPSPSPKGLAKDSTLTTAPTSSGDGGTVLLQPSAFVIPPSSTTTITVDPPTPLIEDLPQIFPSIPPIMHSAGMTAPPLDLQPSGSPKKPRAAHTATASSNQRLPSHTPTGGVAPVTPTGGVAPVTPTGGVAPVTTTEPLPAIQEAQTPPRWTTTTTLAGGSSNSRELSSVLPGRSFTEPSTTLMSPQQFSHPGRDEGTATAQSKKTAIGLTKEQMQEALMYMIQNDRGFVDKLHEAYKMSLTERLA